jgi:hypothetical protein
VHVFKAAHVEPVQSAGVELMREVPLDPLAPLPLQPFASCTLNSPPIAVGSPARQERAHDCIRAFELLSFYQRKPRTALDRIAGV